MKSILILVGCLGLWATAGLQPQSCAATHEPKRLDAVMQSKTQEELSQAYFASGCFWCVEAIYESLKGVHEVVNGYSGGYTQNPTYKSNNTGQTGHAEAVAVHYNPKIISFAELVAVYFGSQNPTQFNGQGPDHGSQYRSIVFYQNQEEQSIVQNQKTSLAEKLGAEIAAEIRPFQKFWKAEEYHQDFEKRNPGHPYIRAISIPRLKRFQSKFPELLKKPIQPKD